MGGHGSTTLGHEMVHGFDNNGKAYDKDGFKLNWWSKKEEKDYANRTKCLSEQEGLHQQHPCHWQLQVRHPGQAGGRGGEGTKEKRRGGTKQCLLQSVKERDADQNRPHHGLLWQGPLLRAA